MKYFQSCGARCAVSFRELRLPISDTEALAILEKKKFRAIAVDILELARSIVSRAIYKRGAQLDEAPAYFDCSGLAKWLYGQLGIRIPRRSIQQFHFGADASVKKLKAGDLLFVPGYIDYYYVDKTKGVGHVGIATGEGTVIHAANRKYGVVESTIETFTAGDKFRGARRIVKDFSELTVLETPPRRFIENSEDIRWVILQNLKADP